MSTQDSEKDVQIPSVQSQSGTYAARAPPMQPLHESDFKGTPDAGVLAAQSMQPNVAQNEVNGGHLCSDKQCSPQNNVPPPKDAVSQGVAAVQQHELIHSETVHPGDRHQPKILLIGATGVGKSTMTKDLTGKNVEIGHSLESCTTSCSIFDFCTDDGRKVTIVDTPGFGDTNRSDLEILQEIADVLAAGVATPISAIMLLYRITDARVTGTSTLILNFLRSFAGESFYPYIFFVTTMWDTVNDREGTDTYSSRQDALRSADIGWGDMTRGKARTLTYTGTRQSAMDIVKCTIDVEVPSQPRFIEEISRGLLLADTSAGKVFIAEYQRREVKRRQEEKLDLEEELQATKRQLENETRAKRQREGTWASGQTQDYLESRVNNGAKILHGGPMPGYENHGNVAQSPNNTPQNSYHIEQGKPLVRRQNSKMATVSLVDPHQSHQSHSDRIEEAGRYERLGKSFGKSFGRFLDKSVR